MSSSSQISPDLKILVFDSVKLLGLAIKEVYGEEVYTEIETLRLSMKKVRGADSAIVFHSLGEVYKKLKLKKTDHLHKISKSFSLMLELINSCEAAFRSHKLEGEKIQASKSPYSLVYVFTSHPTEARSKAFLEVMSKIEKLLSQSLHDGFKSIEEELSFLLKIAVRINLANNKRPQVKDEAFQIFHMILDDNILSEQIRLKKNGIDVFFRTWVGGDKDGHPKVGPETMIQSMNLSRGRLVKFISNKLDLWTVSIYHLEGQEKLISEIKKFKTFLKTTPKVATNDGLKIKNLKKEFHKLKVLAEKAKLLSPDLIDIEELFWLYPALVLPLEIREDSELIHKALASSRLTIARMLKLLSRISKGMDSKWYVRGFVISMCQSSEDVLAAAKLTKTHLKKFSIPVVPLFENEAGLKNGVQILQDSFKKFNFKEEHTKQWGGRFEVMVGYSDSSKENGVLSSRLMVQEALYVLDDFIQKNKLTPVFFHGSGGSISRGGGSIKEQIAWWPQSALNIYKVTIQGEMVQRSFHQSLIMRSQVKKIVEDFAHFKPRDLEKSDVLEKFSSMTQNEYRELVKDKDFQHLVELATPYTFLNLLKIGSRPTKRVQKGEFSLRAIPWILCWTQTRLLLPIWWGTGSSWEKLTQKEKTEMRKVFKTSPLLQSYIKNLGFTFAKMELGVWEFQLMHSELSQEEKEQWKKVFREEYEKSLNFFYELTNEKSFTWFRPWLSESIFFRSSMIHPISVIQKIALERKDAVLLRETVTGIACGMLTTG